APAAALQEHPPDEPCRTPPCRHPRLQYAGRHRNLPAGIANGPARLAPCHRSSSWSPMSIYNDWGLEPIINASGAVTRLGGAPMREAVLEAFCAAARDSVPLDALQAVASRALAEATGAEAGLVTSGAAAALTLGTAAILTGYDLGRMERLPCCAGFPPELIVARETRNGYDHAVRAAGARLVEVGFNEIVAGAGVRRTGGWEDEAAFGPQTAGGVYV